MSRALLVLVTLMPFIIWTTIGGIAIGTAAILGTRAHNN